MKRTVILLAFTLLSFAIGLSFVANRQDTDSQTQEIVETTDSDEFEGQNFDYETIDLKLGQETFRIDIADSDAKQRQGLSYRSGLEDKTGMLFVYSQPRTLKFWMKDMRFNLDIIWLSSDKEIVAIEKDVSPDTYPEAFGPDEPTQYVLEVVGGYSDEHSISIGDFVDFEYFADSMSL